MTILFDICAWAFLFFIGLYIWGDIYNFDANKYTKGANIVSASFVTLIYAICVIWIASQQ